MWVSYISPEATAHQLTGKKKFKRMICTQIVEFSSRYNVHKGWQKQVRKRSEAEWLHSTQTQPLGTLEKHRQAFLFLRGRFHQDNTVQGRPPSHQSRVSISSDTYQWLFRPFTVYTANTRQWVLYWLQGIEYWVKPLWAAIFMPELIEV